MTTLTLSYRILKAKTKSASLPDINLKVICLFCCLSLILLLAVYIFLVNQLTLGAYLIKNYNKEINQLSEQNRSLEINLAQVNFMGQISKKAFSMDFQKTTQINYIKLFNDSLASAEIAGLKAD